MNDAIITGADARACICFGGLMITFNGETSAYARDFRLIQNGGSIGITDKDKFPVYVKFDWKETQQMFVTVLSSQELQDDKNILL